MSIDVVEDTLNDETSFGITGAMSSAEHMAAERVSLLPDFDERYWQALGIDKATEHLGEPETLQMTLITLRL